MDDTYFTTLSVLLLLARLSLGERRALFKNFRVSSILEYLSIVSSFYPVLGNCLTFLQISSKFFFSEVTKLDRLTEEIDIRDQNLLRQFWILWYDKKT